MWELFKTELFLSNESSSPLGRIRLAGTVAASTGVQNRMLDSYAIVLEVAGAGAYSDELGHEQRIGPGDLLVLFPGLRHTYGPAVRGERWDEIYVVFDGPVFALLEQSGILDRGRPVVRVEPHEPAVTQLMEFSRAPRPSDERGRMLEVCSFVRLLTAMVVPAAPRETWVERARSRLATNLDRQLDLEAVAAEAGTSYESFRKRFRQAVDVAPAEFRNARRIETARQMLASTPLTIKQIAINLGYFDEYHFSRRFRAATGSAPGAYRRRIRVGGDAAS